MTVRTKNNLKALLSGMVGAFIILCIFFILTIKYIDNNYPNINSNITSSSDNNQSTSVGKIYENTVDSVISVVNMKDINVSNDMLQKFLEEYYGGNSIEQGVGSGFVYKKENGYYYAVTNNHVVEGSDEVGIITTKSSKKEGSKKLVDAEIVGTNSDYDVAVIKFKTSANIKPLEFADSDKVFPGQEVYAIGSPYGSDFQGSITKGIISAPIRQMFNKETQNMNKYIQTDAAINPGNSGGPLLNQSGEVVGMDTMKIAESESDNMGFAIPINIVNKVIEEIENDKGEE